MIRCTIELLPGGNEARARTIGIVEIANTAVNLDGTGDYAVVMKKTPPFAGALRAAWRRGALKSDDDAAITRAVVGEDEEALIATVTGHHRTRRGAYDLLYRALRACGMEKRNPDTDVILSGLRAATATPPPQEDASE